MPFYLKQGNRVTVIANGAVDVRNELPPSNYVVMYDKQHEEYSLEEIEPFTLPSKYYGDIDYKAGRIISSYHDRSSSTGVLLSGEKGSGKTLLAKKISNLLLAEGIATIVINECFHGDRFNHFIQSIDQPCVIIFDEVEKVYTKDTQDQLLTLLDGTFNTKKLFILTTNNVSRINQHMQNRPGRILYNIKYVGLEVNFIRDYCNDTLLDKSYIDEICRLSTLYAAFNFDMLKALVEEMNRYNESPKESLKMLNATPEDRENKFFVTVVLDGVTLDKSKLCEDGEWAGNPLSPNGVEVEHVNPKHEEDNEVYWKTLRLAPTDLVSVDAKTGTFVFKNIQGDSITLKRRTHMHYEYNAF